MKRRNLKVVAIAALVGGFMGSCDLVKDIEYTVTPNPIEQHGDTCTLRINGKFIEKGLHKKALVEVTPVLVDKDGTTERAFKTEFFKGEKAAGNGIVVPKAGKSFTYNSQIACECGEFATSELKIKILPKKGTKEKEEILTDKIADGVVHTPCLLISDDKVIFGTDNFVRVTQHTENAVINYQKGKSNVRNPELKDQDIVDLTNWITTSMANPKIVMNKVGIMSYASPEGELTKNEGLASDRANSAMAAMKNIFKKATFAPGQEDAFYNLMPKGEDWEGLKKLIQASDHEDKQIIISVAEMNNNDAKREAEIKTLAHTYKFLEKDIFPQLRRSQIALGYDLNGLTDEELLQWSTAKPDSLNLEEILFTANTLVDDLNEKLRLYKVAEKNNPDDWRAANNVGYIYMLQNKIDDASTQFEKAAGLGNDPIIKCNLGVIARLKGNISKAEELFNEGLSAGKECKYNLGLVYIKKGDYGSAIDKMGSYQTFNTALAKYLNGDTSGAIADIDASDDATSGAGYYLKAVVGARTGDKAMMTSNLKSAIDADGSWKAKALVDAEFVKYFEDADFKALVQ
jgi:tetratricopeptide (TPR) repeat protein